MNFIITLLILVVILGLIILVHEFGHFIAAKKSGVYVEEFSLGMGPVLKQFKPKNSETTYSIRWLPIGGYVAMAEKEEKGSKIKKDRVLENKGFLRNFWVMIDGIVFNFILALVIFFISGLIYGRPVNDAIVASVSEGGAFETAGIEKDDRIIEVNGVGVKTWSDFLLEATAKKLQDNYLIKIEKPNGEIKEYNVVPEISEEDGEEVRVFGVARGATIHEKGIANALKYSIEGTVDTFKTIFNILCSLFNGKVSTDSLSGPVGMYSIIDQVKSSGLENILYLIAYLSINVAIVNLIPIPVFDGGRILLLIIEKISRHKTSEKLENILNTVGFLLMILLMIYVTFNDIIRLVVK